ncbi:Ferroporti-1 [Phyllosticta citrichinensis]|uniref:Solute carrier family 40 member n=1 Tax=Phyllosticta citrichinensis TaxID=1130410 RepID=A0ABR1XYH3_9PEZI
MTSAPLHHLDIDDTPTSAPLRRPSSTPMASTPASTSSSVLPLLYVSHTLSTWNSRTFEFGAVLFLATLFPGTLAPASAYALVRAGAAVLLAGKVGAWVDAWDRLRALRWSVVAQRVAVAAGCVVFLAMGRVKRGSDEEATAADGQGHAEGEWRWWAMAALFAGNVALACVEKLGIVGNLVAVERDWVIVIAEETGAVREDLNAVMRRIDLTSKLLAPVFVSLVDGYSSTAAIWVVFLQNALSVVVEYFTIAQVYYRVPGLQVPKTASPPPDEHEEPLRPSERPTQPSYLSILLHPWQTYTRNTAFLASLSLSLLYLTVLSTGVQMQTYLLTLTYTPLSVSLMRLAAVATELLATCAAPLLMRRISAVRAGLWFVNEQLLCVAASTALYVAALSSSSSSPSTSSTTQKAAGASLIAGVTLSRLGLWGFDLCVQYLIQEEVPPAHRGAFSSAEMALQNLFELLSFALTVVFPRPDQFVWPVLISAAAVAVAAACFAAFVRMRRGHLLHASRCVKGRERYSAVPQSEGRGCGDVA